MSVVSCGRHEGGAVPSKETTRDTIAVFVSIVPQAYFVERVGGGRVSVEVLVLPGQSPATYEPTPRQMVALAEADVYFRIGVPFENAFMPRVRSMYPDLDIVDTREGVRLRMLGTLRTPARAGADDPSTRREPQGRSARRTRASGSFSTSNDKSGRGKGTPDPHIWLDPVRVKVQARTIRDELARLAPEHAGEFDANYRAFAADLERVHAEIAEALAPLEGEEMLVFHPAFGYFAEAYGLRQVAIETGGKEPGARRLAGLIEKAKARGAKVIFVQREFSTANARAVARAIGGRFGPIDVVPLDALARDYLANLREMAEKVRSRLGAGTVPQAHDAGVLSGSKGAGE